MSDPAEAANPLADVPVLTLTERLLEVESHRGVLGRLSVRLRAEIQLRAVKRWREDGMAPTFRGGGLGSISLPVPQDSCEVADRAAFGSWVAEHYPHNATCQVLLDQVAPADLEALLEAVTAVKLRMKVTASVAVAPAFEKGLLDKAAIAGTLALDPEGRPIDGVKVTPGADPKKPDGPQPKSISVRLDPQAKADAEASAEARLGDVLSHGLRASGVGRLADDEVDPADGEPDHDPLCRCDHDRSAHRGKAHAGSCSQCPPAHCRRFKAAQVPSWS